MEQRQSVLTEALEAARAIEYEDSRSWAPSALAPQLPAEILGLALDAARTIQNKHARSRVLLALVLSLLLIQRASLRHLWPQTLRILAARTRTDFLTDLQALAPVLFILADQGGPTLVAVAQAVSDVGRWWP
jgi:hypothetical protein